MTQLREGFRVRSATMDDLDALSGLFNEYWEAITGVTKFTLEDFQSIFSTPGFDMEASLHVVLSPQDQMIGCVLVTDLSSPPVHPIVYGCVRKGYEGQGIGTYLLNWAEIRARQAIEHCPENARVSMYVQSSQSHEPTIHLFEKLGLSPVRFSWFMMKNLDDEPPKPIWPDGIRVTTFKEFSNLEAILKATDEAFEDHWGHVDRSGDKERIDRFRHSIESNDEFDPSIWYLAVDGDEIAGVALCNSRLGPDRETGVVDVLGVRRPWRRQGLGLALLHHAFGEFLQRGYKQVGLGVDTQNLSGATRLYEKAGMQVAREFAVYEKELRVGEEISKQST